MVLNLIPTSDSFPWNIFHIKKEKRMMKRVEWSGVYIFWDFMRQIEEAGMARRQNQKTNQTRNQNKHNLIFHLFSYVNKINQSD